MAVAIQPLNVELLKEETGIKDQDLDQSISPQSLWDFAEHFGSWEKSIHGLQLTEGEISDVRESAYRHSSNRMAMYEALKIWLKKNPFKTYRSLVEIQLKFQEGSIAVDICRTIVRLDTEASKPLSSTVLIPKTTVPSDPYVQNDFPSPPSSTTSSGIDIDNSLTKQFVKLTCDCGKCSIVGYLNGKCRCTSSKPPQITIFTPNPPISTDRVERTQIPYSVFQTALLTETEKLHDKFCGFLYDTFEMLERSTHFSKVKEYCKSILISGVYHAPMYNTSQESSLSMVESFPELKHFLQRNYCSWYNYSFIATLRGRFLFSEPSEDNELQIYERYFRKYVSRRCFLYLQDLGPEPQLETVSVICKVDVEFGTITEEHIQKLKWLFIEHLDGYSQYSLTLKHVQEGCTELIFRAPASFKNIPALKASQVAILRQKKFIEVRVGNRNLLTEVPQTQSDSTPSAKQTVGVYTHERHSLQPASPQDIIAGEATPLKRKSRQSQPSPPIRVIQNRYTSPTKHFNPTPASLVTGRGPLHKVGKVNVGQSECTTSVGIHLRRPNLETDTLPKQKQEVYDSTKPTRDVVSKGKEDMTWTSSKITPQFEFQISSISPITLPGFETPINFADLPPPPRNFCSSPSSSGYSSAKCDTDTCSDSSPTTTSPPDDFPYISSQTSRVHIYISPPPKIDPKSYSPHFPIKSSGLNMYKPTPGYGTRIPPPGDFSGCGIEEEVTPRRPSIPPEAFKFFIEHHIENVYKAYRQRQQRRAKLELEMARRKLDKATSEQMRQILYKKESNFLRIKRAKMHLGMFATVKVLGIGAFGVISLVRKIDTNKLYAMKTLEKAEVLKRNQVAHVKAERDILAEADNEWVVKLFCSFQDSEKLYFVMEYSAGGDIMSLLIKLDTFPEHLTLFYIAELVCAIESVHKMGFIHGNIKPDNILIGSDGHIKLTDFGLCTGFRWTDDSNRYLPKGQHQRHQSIELHQFKDAAHNRSVAHSLLGTSNYIAPEILRQEGIQRLCDWWSVGAIMYETLIGQPPFMATTPAETQRKIINWSQHLYIPRHAVLSPAAADLILKFCCDPDCRIGRKGVDEIKWHPFFSAIDWNVGIRNYEPPYIPKVMYDTDTSNFDPIQPDQLQKMKSGRDVSTLPKGHPEQDSTFYSKHARARAGQERHPRAKTFGHPPPTSSASPSAKKKHSQPVYV